MQFKIFHEDLFYIYIIRSMNLKLIEILQVCSVEYSIAPEMSL